MKIENRFPDPITLLLSAFALSLAFSMAAAQILAGVLIFCAATSACFDRPSKPVQWIWAVALFFVVALTAINFFVSPTAGIAEGLGKTWMILIAPAAATFGASRRWPAVKNSLIWSFALAAVLFFYQISTSDPAVAGRYGFHRSPYALAMLLIVPSLLVMTRFRIRAVEFALWLIFVIAIVLVNTRGVSIACLASSLYFFVRFPHQSGQFSQGRRLPKRFAAALAAIILLVAVLSTQRWTLLDLENQSSIEQRLVIWSEVIGQFKSRPILGYGFNNLFPDPGHVAPEYRSYLTGQNNPHSGYLMILHATGLLGYTVLCSIYGAAFTFVSCRIKQDDPAYADNPAHTDDHLINLVAASSLLAVMIASLSDKTFFMTLPALQTWFLVGWAMGIEKSKIQNPKSKIE